MTYEWNENKNKLNYQKHSVYFEEAQTVWADPMAIEAYDPDHSTDEDRFLKLGISSRGRTLLVVFCERRSEIVRIISARKATAKERAFYERRI